MRVTVAERLMVWGRAPGGASPQLHSDLHLHSSEDAAASCACHAQSASRRATRNEDLTWTKIVSIP